ncbi:transposable element tc3 transposase-like protein [Holotrichia oblita]|uniref:Transposable element tc3 transposase-like protein n=1 Tax=Holotrichia oblita TaxID=644536 RepID=A0ACB9TUU1_HOLOL|nr:transposable element tc3 transposase-like protein [Holotrichia oblita]
MNFTFNEYADMYMICDFCRGNVAGQEYRVRFPNRRHPSKNVFQRLDERLREIGWFTPRNANVGRPRQSRTVQLEEQVLATMQEDPSTSTRQLASTLNIPSIAELVKNAFNRTAAIEKAVNGFQTTGIFPFSPDLFSEEELICLPKVNNRRDETFNPSERHQTPSPIPAPPEELGRSGPSGVGSKKRKILHQHQKALRPHRN